MAFLSDFALNIFSGYPLRSSEGHSKKTFHHRVTEDKEKSKRQSGVLCALCVSSERNERVVKRIVNPDNNDLSEVDNQKNLFIPGGFSRQFCRDAVKTNSFDA